MSNVSEFLGRKLFFHTQKTGEVVSFAKMSFLLTQKLKAPEAFHRYYTLRRHHFLSLELAQNTSFTQSFISFVRSLEADGQLRYIKKIIATFLNYARIYSYYLVIKVITESKLNEEFIQILENKLYALYKTQVIEIQYEIDEEILAGIIIIAAGKILDFSLRNKLQSLVSPV
jgi:F0F1-type ATP synthase delta subunit